MKKAAALILLLVIAAPAAGRAESQAGSRLKLYFSDAFLPHLWSGAKAVFTTPENWAWFALGGALTVAAHQYDGRANDYFKDHELAWGMADFGNDFWGDGLVQGALALTLMTGGYYTGNEKAAAAGEVLAEAQIIQGAMINIIKPIAHKQRPNGSNYQSFPSGHAGTAFCTAAVLQDRFGWKVGAPAYGLAAVTGLARMDVQAHWLSDVVMGAAIAMVVGHAVSENYDPYPYDVRFNRPQLTLVPLVDSEVRGLMIHLSF